MRITREDKEILRHLANEYAEIAALPIHEENRTLWKKLNGLKPERPMVIIDQVCWNEMNYKGEITTHCSDPFLAGLEGSLRKKLYQWKHFPVDMMFDSWIGIPMAIGNSGFGLEVKQDTEYTDKDNSVISHHYINVLENEDDLDQLRMPVITHDKAETDRRLEIGHDIFDGIIELRCRGYDPYLSLWDPISGWMSVESALYAMIDRPDFIHKILSRMTDGYLSMLDQLEDLGVLCNHECQSAIHCTGAYTDELPGANYNPEKPRCKDIWMFGLAQMLGVVSPEMFDEFEVQYTSRICERFGMVYYGCCDPLDKKMEQVRKLPNVRKVSMSPWADHRNGAEQIGGEFVFSSKPNPANVAMDRFCEEHIRRELTEIKQACDDNGCPLEFIFKDISTVRHDPERLDQWAKVAMEVAQA